MLHRILVLPAALLLAACSDHSDIGPNKVVTVRVVPESVSVAVGDTIRVGAFPLDADTAFLPQAAVTWASEAGGVATVDAAGLITGVASGNTLVDATAQGVVGKVIVVVP